MRTRQAEERAAATSSLLAELERRTSAVAAAEVSPCSIPPMGKTNLAILARMIGIHELTCAVAMQAEISATRLALERSNKALEEEQARVTALQQAAAEREATASERQAAADAALRAAETKSADAAAALAQAAEKEAELAKLQKDVWSKAK